MEIVKGVVHSPISLQLYIASQCTFLALNLTGVNSTLIRYSVWVTAITIQLIFIPGQIQTKLPVIIGSLMRDCHFQLVDLVLSYRCSVSSISCHTTSCCNWVHSRSDDPDSRAVQNIFRGLTKSRLLVKYKKSDLICRANKTYDVTYRTPCKDRNN